ncbi:hypothetical protein AB0E83_00005 [Streptomyces sp. NPDC035033]
MSAVETTRRSATPRSAPALSRAERAGTPASPR